MPVLAYELHLDTLFREGVSLEWRSAQLSIVCQGCLIDVLCSSLSRLAKCAGGSRIHSPCCGNGADTEEACERVQHGCSFAAI
jgi:hypothetical protein